MNIPPSDANMPVVSLRNYIRRPKLNLVAREESNCSMESELPGTQSQETTESNDEQSQRTATAQAITSEDAVVANDYETGSNASFHDCSSPPPIPEPNEAESTHAEYQLRDSSAFHDNSQTNDLVYKLLTTISPNVHFPVQGERLHRSGPDLVIYWAAGEIFYDLTVVHDLAPSLAGTTPAKAIKDAIARKNTKYVSSNMFAEEKFACLPVLSSGSLHARTRELLRLLAEKISIEPSKVENDFILLLQEMNGNILLDQLRKYLSQSHGDDICAF